MEPQLTPSRLSRTVPIKMRFSSNSSSISISTSQRSTFPSVLSLTLSILLAFLVVVFPSSVTCDRTKAKIYIDLLEAKGCFRRMNANGVVGCQSSYNGDVGVVHFFEKVRETTFCRGSGAFRDKFAQLFPV